MKKSYLVIGLGRFGTTLAQELFSLGNEVVVMDEDEDKIAKISDSVTSAFIGNAKDDTALKAVGINNYDCIIVAIADDIADSIITTLNLKELGAKNIICKAQDQRHAKALTLIGANMVIRPEHDMGRRLAHKLSRINIIDYIELSTEFSIVEIETPGQWAGKTIAENRLRNRYKITVIAVRRKNAEHFDVSPGADYLLSAGDLLVIIGGNKDMAAAGINI